MNMKFYRFLIAMLAIFWISIALAQKAEIDAPLVVQPFNGTKVSTTVPQFMVFIWLRPTVPPGRLGANYNLYMRYKFELIDMSTNYLLNPEDAFNSPAVRPYYVEDNIKSTNLVYNKSKPSLRKGHTYAVRVTAYIPQADNGANVRF